MMDLTFIIDMIMEFIVDHIGLVIGALILLSSITSVRNKAKKAAEQEENSGESNEPQQPGKTFRDIMAEIQAELESDSEQKPWADAAPKAPPKPPVPPIYREESAAPMHPSGEGPHPWEHSVNRAPVSPNVEPKNTPVTPKTAPSNVPVKPGVRPHSVPMAEAIDIAGDLTKTDLSQTVKKVKKTAKRNDLVTAVIMSEVLGKPKGLQD